jgi:hypothetical protein
MKAVYLWSLAFALAGSLTASAQMASKGQKSTASAKPAVVSAQHPKIPAGQECSECHQQEVARWSGSPHGINLVKCLVCHGSLEENFMAKPPASRCEGCHGRQVEQLKSDSFMKGKTCFTCHPPHALLPHPLAATEVKP